MRSRKRRLREKEEKGAERNGRMEGRKRKNDNFKKKINKILAFLTINCNLVSLDPKHILAYKAQESKLKCYH